MSYEPKHADNYERMLKVFSAAESKSELEQLMMLYVLDMSYAREDILMAAKTTERAKKWGATQ